MRTVGLTFEEKRAAKKAPAKPAGKPEDKKPTEPTTEPDESKDGKPVEAPDAVQKAVDEAKKAANATS
ncbi:MAG: hypothetical protein RR842_14390 [Gordonibacter sp.]|uniref:hypothetical protein n=1 Tax=Gordonibacter sp. TaxID=1968902 RepID=UPI002FC87EF7